MMDEESTAHDDSGKPPTGEDAQALDDRMEADLDEQTKVWRAIMAALMALDDRPTENVYWAVGGVLAHIAAQLYDLDSLEDCKAFAARFADGFANEIWHEVLALREEEATDTNCRPNYTLLDAVEHNRKHADSFWIPEERRRKAVGVGDSVQLVFTMPDEWGTERMWVAVTEASGDKLAGTLDNNPIASTCGYGGLHYGDVVQFERRNIINIYDEGYRQYLSERESA